MNKILRFRLFSVSLIGLISLSTVIKTSSSALTQTINHQIPQFYSLNSTYFIWPTTGTITQGYRSDHKGIDIAGATGTPVWASKAGTVVFAGWDNFGLGSKIKIQHLDGTYTVYGHNRRLLVRQGQWVQQGGIIAEMGSTGRSTGPHLHFEIHSNASATVNPIAYLPPLIAGRTPPRTVF